MKNTQTYVTQVKNATPIALTAEETRQLATLREQLARGEYKLVTATGAQLALPEVLKAILEHAMAVMIAGEAITIGATRREMTTGEVAELLGLSRQYVIKLIDTGALPAHHVGTHRRVLLQDALAYQERRYLKLSQDMQRISQLNQALGD